jgi:exodeoxyribonuclease VII, large subunit
MSMSHSNDGVEAGGVPAEALTVGELNRTVKRVLRAGADRFPKYVVGEVADVNRYSFGTFFELRDPNAEPVISCLGWADALSAVDHELDPGTTVVVEASVDFYPDRGDCQLLVADFWPVGESERQEELAAVRERLTADGVFDPAQSQTPPDYPNCVGLVTSPSGSAREDVWSAINGRSPRTDVKLFGATVQGDRAVSSLVAGVSRLADDPDIEVIIITRGGGSDTDLWCFNAEPLARCVADAATPVIAAIGHEDDDTIVEEAADRRAMTPTEAGVVATTPIDRVLADLATSERRIDDTYTDITDERTEALDRRIENGLTAVEYRHSRRESTRDRVLELERRIATGYAALVTSRLDRLDQRIDRGLRDIARETETTSATRDLQRRQVADLEARIDAAYESRVVAGLDRFDQRIDFATADLKATRRATQAQRLRVAVAVLLLILILVVSATMVA